MREPQVSARPSRLRLSLSATGTPASGPGSSPAAIRRSISAARGAGLVLEDLQVGADQRLDLGGARQAGLQHLDRGHLAAAHPGGDLLDAAAPRAQASPLPPFTSGTSRKPSSDAGALARNRSRGRQSLTADPRPPARPGRGVRGLRPRSSGADRCSRRWWRAGRSKPLLFLRSETEPGQGGDFPYIFAGLVPWPSSGSLAPMRIEATGGRKGDPWTNLRPYLHGPSLAGWLRGDLQVGRPDFPRSALHSQHRRPRSTVPRLPSRSSICSWPAPVALAGSCARSRVST